VKHCIAGHVQPGDEPDVLLRLHCYRKDCGLPVCHCRACEKSMGDLFGAQMRIVSLERDLAELRARKPVGT